jgi:signal transduction histidine kinase
VVPLVIGIVLFALIIAGMILNTIFLVREIRRNEQQDSFVNAVTHELKTPITSIRMYIETLQSRTVTEAQRNEFYRIMHHDTDRLMATVEQVLLAAQTSQKRRVHEWAPVNIAALLHECVEAARTRHHLDPGSLIEVPCESSTQTVVMGDAEELRIALTNVLDNAVKYSIGSVQIRAAALTEGIHVLVRISDQGVGIPTNELKRIFKRFYRAGRARATVKGTGLGLFIVRATIKKHRGDVRAYSEGEGQGAQITLRLPRYVPQ